MINGVGLWHFSIKQIIAGRRCSASVINKFHSGETDEVNCSWLHPIWPPPKRPDQNSTFCVVSREFKEFIFCIRRVCDVRNKVFKPRRLVCQSCRHNSAWKSHVLSQLYFGIRVGWSQLSTGMKPTDSRTWLTKYNFFKKLNNLFSSISILGTTDNVFHKSPYLINTLYTIYIYVYIYICVCVC